MCTVIFGLLLLLSTMTVCANPMVEKKLQQRNNFHQSILQQRGLLGKQTNGIYNVYQSTVKEQLQQEKINDHQSTIRKQLQQEKINDLQSMAAHEKMDSKTLKSEKMDSQASAPLKSSDKYLLPQLSEKTYENLYQGDTEKPVQPNKKSTGSIRGLMLVFGGKRWKFHKPALWTLISMQTEVNDRRTIGNEPTQLHPSEGRYEAPGLYHGDTKNEKQSSKKSARRLPTHQYQPSKKFKKSIGTRRLLDMLRFVAGRVKLNSRPKAGAKNGSHSVEAGSRGGSQQVKEANKKGSSSSKPNSIRDVRQMQNDWYIIKPPRAGKDSPTAMNRIEGYVKEKPHSIGNAALRSNYNHAVKNKERRNDSPGHSSADKTEHTDNLYWLWR